MTDTYEFIIGANGIEYAVINHGNGQFTSMTKAYFDSLDPNPYVNADE